MKTAFDDPDNRESEDLSFKAKEAEVVGDEQCARSLRARAGELRRMAALRTTLPASRSVMAIGAVALLVRSGQLDRATEVAAEFFTQPDLLTTYAVAELQRLTTG